MHSKGLTEDIIRLQDGGNNGNEISKNSRDIGNIKHPIFHPVYPLDKWKDMLKQCHKELDGTKQSELTR